MQIFRILLQIHDSMAMLNVIVQLLSTYPITACNFLNFINQRFYDQMSAPDRKPHLELSHAAAKVLGERDPALGRLQVDMLNGSKYANMKEL